MTVAEFTRVVVNRFSNRPNLGHIRNLAPTGRLKWEKGLAIIVTALSLTGIFYANNAKQSSMDTNQRVATHQYEVLAREAALAGYNTAKQRLADGNTDGFTGIYEGGSYVVTVANNSGMVRIKICRVNDRRTRQDSFV